MLKGIVTAAMACGMVFGVALISGQAYAGSSTSAAKKPTVVASTQKKNNGDITEFSSSSSGTNHGPRR
jgi:hypothetical protein